MFGWLRCKTHNCETRIRVDAPEMDELAERVAQKVMGHMMAGHSHYPSFRNFADAVAVRLCRDAWFVRGVVNDIKAMQLPEKKG